MDITDQELSHQETTLSENQGRVLLLACGALAREILDIIARHGFTHLDLKCLPAILHNAPEKITPLIEEKIAEHRAAYDDIYVLYADCGTGGLLQAACDRLGVKMLRGPHCYSFFEGNEDFAKRDEFTAFYLTDFLVRQFDAFVWKPLGLIQLCIAFIHSETTGDCRLHPGDSDSSDHTDFHFLLLDLLLRRLTGSWKIITTV